MGETLRTALPESKKKLRKGASSDLEAYLSDKGANKKKKLIREQDPITESRDKE